MANVIGTRTTGQSISEDRLIRVVDADIALLEPDLAPLITMLNYSTKQRRRTTSPRFEYYEDDYVARWAQNSSAAVANTTASTIVTVVDSSLFVVGDLFIVPKVVTSSAAAEICRVTAVNRTTHELTVIRNVGSAGIDTIGANAALRLIGDAHEEQEGIGTSKTTTKTKVVGYTQIFRTVVEFSKTAVASSVYGAANGDREREHAKKLKEHKQKLNGAALFGRASEALTGGASSRPIRTTDGLLSRISTNITDAGGTMTRKLFESFARQAFRYGGSEKVLLASPLVISAINQWATQFLLVEPSEKQFGLNINRVQTGHGSWLLVRDWMLEDGISGGNGFAGQAFSVDPKQIFYRYLEDNGLNRDTKLTENVVQTGIDGFVDEIVSEVGFEIKQERYHARLFNVTDYSA